MSYQQPVENSQNSNIVANDIQCVGSGQNHCVQSTDYEVLKMFTMTMSDCIPGHMDLKTFILKTFVEDPGVEDGTVGATMGVWTVQFS